MAYFVSFRGPQEHKLLFSISFNHYFDIFLEWLLYVKSSLLTCILSDMPSLSDNSSARFLVPSTFLRVVWASSCVDECALLTLATEEMGQCMRKYTTPSTDTVTESLVRIWEVQSCSYDVATKLITQEDGRQISLMMERNCDTGETQLIFSHLVMSGTKQRTSCGGMSKDTVLRSTFTKVSVQGRTKNRPGRK